MTDPDRAAILAPIHTVYEILSGRAGEARDWARFQTLYAPEARMRRISVDAEGRVNVRVFDVAGYIRNVDNLFANEDFHEVEIAHRIDRFGRMAQVLSAYSARRGVDDKLTTWRGVNGIHVVDAGDGWRIASVVWDIERPGVVFPPPGLTPT